MVSLKLKKSFNSEKTQVEGDSKGVVLWAINGDSWSFSIEKESALTVAFSHKSFFYLWILIGLLSWQLFAFSQLPKLISVFQDILLEEAK